MLKFEETDNAEAVELHICKPMQELINKGKLRELSDIEAQSIIVCFQLKKDSDILSLVKGKK
jgi:hypothetical protein